MAACVYSNEQSVLVVILKQFFASGLVSTNLLLTEHEGRAYGLMTKYEVKMAGYWQSSIFSCSWTETESSSINSQKKSVTNIQPS